MSEQESFKKKGVAVFGYLQNVQCSNFARAKLEVEAQSGAG